MVRAPAVLLDKRGRFIDANASGAKLLTDTFDIDHHMLRSVTAAADGVFQAALGGILRADRPNLAEPSPPLRLPKRDGSIVAVGLSIVAGPLADTVRQPRVIVTFKNLDEDQDAAARLLRRRFALTSAEVRIALAVGEGLSVLQIADTFRISPMTTRTHLRAIFAKTDTHRQTELALLVAKASRTF